MQRLRDPVNRNTVAIALIIVSAMFGSLALWIMGPDRATLAAIGAIVTCCGPAAGWIHPQLLQFRRRAAVGI